MNFKQFLAEMPEDELDTVEDEIKKLFRSVNVAVKFTKHFEDRAVDGGVDEKGRLRGELVKREELLDVFKKVKEKHDELVALSQEHRPELQGVIRDALINLNIPFTLAFDKRSGKYLLTLLTIMKKTGQQFFTKKDDVPVDV